MPHRRLVPVLVAAAAAVLVAGACTEQSAALRVGDESVSRTEIYDELEFITTNEEFRSARFGEGVEVSELLGTLRSSYPQDFVASILAQRLGYMLAGDVLEANDIEVTESDRDGVTDQLDELLSGGADSLPDEYRDDLVEGLARLSVLEGELGSQEANAQLREAAESADIDVSSHFGSWNPDTLSIDPPPGPAGAPADDEAGTGPE
ncbi:MAG TPA: hypothetical protein VFM27_18465 [Acidimicrobiales bacterium]|nr:hypothetical protein [Acidimicrobiales bacterium]